MSTRFTAAPIIALALCLGASTTGATLITFTVTGTINTVSNSSNLSALPFPNMAVGDHFSVTVSYNDAVCGSQNPCVPPSFASYFLNLVSITDGSTTFQPGLGGTGSFINITNDGSTTIGTVGDEIAVETDFVGGPNDNFQLQLIGSTQPLTSTTIPVSNPGSLPGWDPSNSTVGFQWSNQTISGFDSQSFSGLLDVAVPEPNSLGLLALGFGLLADLHARTRVSLAAP